MIAIKGMEMPSCCMNCIMRIDGYSAGYYCAITNEELNDNSTLKYRHPSCPLIESKDYISRQAAIDKMQELEDEDIKAYGCSIPEGFDGQRAIRALKSL